MKIALVASYANLYTLCFPCFYRYIVSLHRGVLRYLWIRIWTNFL